MLGLGWKSLAVPVPQSVQLNAKRPLESAKPEKPVSVVQQGKAVKGVFHWRQFSRKGSN